MNVMFLTHGTDGDVHPLVGLGIALRNRGHRVTLMLNEFFQSHAARNGFDFVPMGTADEYQRMLDLPGLYHPIQSAKILGRYVTGPMREQYRKIVDRFVPGQTVVVASGAAFGARIAQDKLGIPLATVVVQPAVLRSAHRPPVVSGMPRIPTWLPRSAKRVLFRLFDAVADSVFLRSDVNAFRAELGLPPVKRLLNTWWLSPKRIIGLFPDWFGDPQPDWPAHLRLTGFPMYDERNVAPPLSDEHRRVFETDPAPVVFTPGTGVKRGHRFFQSAVEACREIRRPAVLLTRYPQQLPQHLPETIKHFDYLPFSQVLPMAGAIVHAGGIGTCAQALAAGIPQLLMPMAYDQPDNADRLMRMGVGEWIHPKHFAGPVVAAALQRLLNSSEMRMSCRTVARRFLEGDPVAAACDCIEALAQPTPTWPDT